VLGLGGVKDVNAKIVSRSKDKLNIAQATIKALQEVSKGKK
jgi:ribosomal protein S5